MNGLLTMLGFIMLVASILFKEPSAYLCGMAGGLFLSSIVASFYPKKA
jgi:hypothetical protein|nr:MAG TPA: hypothetical protein [Caudoviricetes sp.]